MKPSNSRSLLSFLVGSLPQAVFGERHYKERIISLIESLWWEVGFECGFKSELPAPSVDSAVVALNARLKKEGLPYRVGRRCQCGDPCSQKFKQVAPYIVGLVDIRQPLAPELVRNLRAV